MITTTCKRHKQHDRECFDCVRYALYDAREEIHRLNALVELGKDLRDAWTRQLGRFPAIVGSLHLALNRWDQALSIHDKESKKGKKDEPARAD